MACNLWHKGGYLLYPVKVFAIGLYVAYVQEYNTAQI